MGEYIPAALARFVKAATGGGSLSWRQWIVPLRFSELPSWSHVVWVLVPVVLGGAAYRWYLALQWYGLVPASPDDVVGLLLILLACVGYPVWLYREYVRGTAQA